MPKRPRSSRAVFPAFESLELRAVPAAVIAGSISQNADFVGQDASAGPDGKSDISLAITGLTKEERIIAADVIGTFAGNNGGSMRWRYGDNPLGLPRAEIVRISGRADDNYQFGADAGIEVATIYLGTQPSDKVINRIDVNLVYGDGTSDNGITTMDTSLANIVPGQVFSRPAGASVTNGGNATFQSPQYAADDASWGQKAGDSWITLDKLPTGFNAADIVELSLSDGKGSLTDAGGALKPDQGGAIWSSNATKYNSARLSYRTAPGPQPGYVADIAFPPVRDEADATMTLRMVLRPSSGANQVFYTQFTGKASNLNKIDAAKDKRTAFPKISVSAAADPTKVTYQDPVTSTPVTETLASLLARSGNEKYQHVYLNAGNYSINYASPSSGALVIANPLLLEGHLDAMGRPDAVLIFTANSTPTGQSQSGTAYESAVWVKSSHVKVSNLKVRFQDQVKFLAGDDGAAIKAQADGRLVDVEFRGLDIIGPAPAYDLNTGAEPRGRPAQYTIRFNASGVIDRNVIRGGGILTDGGPISITNNFYVGTVPTKDIFPPNYGKPTLSGKIVPSYIQTFLKCTSPFDQVITGNDVRVTLMDDTPTSNEVLGAAYRFLLFKVRVGSGSHNLVSDNKVTLGRRFADETSPSAQSVATTDVPVGNPDNTLELILNETYDVTYEGTSLPLGGDRRVLSIPHPDTARWQRAVLAGDVVAILAGRFAGQYRTIAQVVGRNTFILNEPMPETGSNDPFIVSVVRGLVDTEYSRNVIDLKGTTSIAFVLAGNQFDVRIHDNTILGDDTYIIDGNKNVDRNTAIQLRAQQNELSKLPSTGTGYQVPFPLPSIAWTLCPTFDAEIRDNTINNVLGGIVIFGEDDATSFGRTYIKADVLRNKFTGYGSSPTVGTGSYAIEATTLISVGYSLLNKGNDNGNYDITSRTYGFASLDGNRAVIKNPSDSSLYLQPAANTTTSSGTTRYRFADPAQIRVGLSGNWLERAPGATYNKNTVIISAVVNDTPTVLTQGEATTALPTTSPNANDPSRSFVFGNGDKAFPAGFTPVYAYTNINDGLGYGFVNLPGGSNGKAGAIYSPDMTFQVDLPNGTYDVTPTLGDFGGGGTMTFVEVFIQGVRVAAVDAGPGATLTPTYLATVTDGHLKIRLHARDGKTPVELAYLHDLRITPRAAPLNFQFGQGGLVPAAGRDAITNFTSYHPTLGYGFDGLPANSNATTGAIYSPNMIFRVDLPNGIYLVAPTLGDFGGNAPMIAVTVLVQGKSYPLVTTSPGVIVTPTYVAVVANGQLSLQLIARVGTNPVELAYIHSLKITPLQFTFGNGEAPTPKGSTPVSQSTHHSLEVGYGISGQSIDFNGKPQSLYGTDITFQVDLPNGTYDVTPSLGDFGGSDSMSFVQVFIQGSRIAAVATGPGATTTPTYLAIVADGHLRIRLIGNDAPGSRVFAYLHGLKIVPRVGTLNFQFGEAGLVPAAGFDAATNFTEYLPGRGDSYGFVNLPGGSTATSTAVYSANMTFQVDMRNGIYEITFTLGGTGGASDGTDVTIENFGKGQLQTASGPVTKKYVVVVSDGTFTLNLKSVTANLTRLQTLTIVRLAAIGDYDGDGRTDIGLYDPATWTFTILTSGSSYPGFISKQYVIGYGTNYMPLVGDYDGDLRADVALFDPGSETFYILYSSSGYSIGKVKQYAGVGPDSVPLVGDYDGDRKTDVALYDPTTSTFYYLTAASYFEGGNYKQFTITGGSNLMPLAGDYDGDGKTDFALYIPSTRTFTALTSSTSYTYTNRFTYQYSSLAPSTLYIPLVGDFDGDGKADVALYDPDTSTFYIRYSGFNFTTGLPSKQFGIPGTGSGYRPFVGDYDGDGKSDFGLYDPSTSTFYVFLSSSNFSGFAMQKQFGPSGHYDFTPI